MSSIESKERRLTIPDINVNTPWPSIEFPYKDGQPILIFAAGFPDNCVSGYHHYHHHRHHYHHHHHHHHHQGWGNVLNELIKEEKYHIICLCMPDYQANCITPKPWGYSPQELLVMLRESIQYYVKDNKQKVNLIVHDWGSYMGQLYENTYPESVERLVLLDVGHGIDETIGTVFVILFYQFYFAFSFILSQVLGKTAGTIFFGMFFILKFDRTIGPCPNEGKLQRPRREISAHLCYIYYTFWKMMLSGNALTPLLPQCPVLFMYGKQKRVFFHSKKFIKHLNDSPAVNRVVAFDAGHWFQIVFPKDTANEITSFIPSIKQQHVDNTTTNTNDTTSPSTTVANSDLLSFIWQIPGAAEL